MWRPLAWLRRTPRSDDDFADEIAAHLALEAERLVAEGRSPHDAVFEARRRFGNVGQVKERFHEGRPAARLGFVGRQLLAAARRLRRVPGFTVAATLTLMLGIGATTAVFSLVNAVLLRPLPFADPSQLVDLTHTMTLQGVAQIDQSDATYLYYRTANRAFTGVGAYQAKGVNLSTTGAADAVQAQRVQAARVSASLFQVLGVAPLRGRTFVESEDEPGASPLVVIGEQLWRTRFGGDPEVLGQRVMIDGVAHELIGVMPRRFTFPGDGTQIWIPIALDPAHTASASFDLHAIARLRPGMTPDAAEADLMSLLPKVPEAYPGRLTAPAIKMTKMRPQVRGLRETVVGRVDRTLWVVFAAAAFLLLIACANVANLLLVRAEARHHELTVRRALGASRSTIAAEFLSESLLISLAGGVLGIGLAAAGLRALSRMQTGIAIPRLDGVGLDAFVMLGAVGIIVLTALLVTVVPAVRAGRLDVSAALGQAGRAVTAGRTRHRVRRAFVGVQMALALVLVAGAGLMVRTYGALRAVAPGFDASNGYALRLALPEAQYPTAAASAAVMTRLLDRLSGLPGATAAGVVSSVPLDPEARQDSGTWVEDRLPKAGSPPNVHRVAFASAHAFSALGARLIQGHEFEPVNPANPAREAIVTRALARRYWGDSAAVGRHIRFSPVGPWYTVVGVTNDIYGSGLDQPPDETVYLPLVVSLGGGMGMGGTSAAGPPLLWAPRNVGFVLRGTATAGDVGAAAVRAIHDAEPSLPVYRVLSLGDVLARSTGRTSFALVLLEIASIAAMVISAVGLFGVVSYIVATRRRELAIRVALGAKPHALRWRIVTQTAAVAGIGIVLGVGAALLLARFMSTLLFGVSPEDPVTLIGAAGLLLAIALAASWRAARVASSVDATEALRAEG